MAQNSFILDEISKQEENEVLLRFRDGNRLIHTDVLYRIEELGKGLYELRMPEVDGYLPLMEDARERGYKGTLDDLIKPLETGKSTLTEFKDVLSPIFPKDKLYFDNGVLRAKDVEYVPHPAVQTTYISQTV